MRNRYSYRRVSLPTPPKPPPLPKSMTPAWLAQIECALNSGHEPDLEAGRAMFRYIRELERDLVVKLGREAAAVEYREMIGDG